MLVLYNERSCMFVLISIMSGPVCLCSIMSVLYVCVD